MTDWTKAKPLFDHAIVSTPEVYHDTGEPDPQALAAEGFNRFLTRLASECSTPRQFATMGFAALWHMNPELFQGASQAEVAKRIGVHPVRFNYAVRKWAVSIGYTSSGMRPRENMKRLTRKSVSR